MFYIFLIIMSPNNPITELSSPLFLMHSFVFLQWFVVEIWPLFEVCLTWMESIVEKLPHLKERETAIERQRGRENEARAAEVLSEERRVEMYLWEGVLRVLKW